MGVGQRNIDRLQGNGMRHLAPIGGHHIGGGGQSGGAPKLGHYFAPRKHTFSAAGVFGIGQYLLLVTAEANRIL